jgi:hypothetical protein
MTKWVATAITSDDPPQTIHVEGQKVEIVSMTKVVPGAGWKIEQKAATWECDGRDNCRVDA